MGVLVCGMIPFLPMKRLLRWAFNGAATASALLFATTCALWARSYLRIDVLVRNQGDVAPRRDVTCADTRMAAYRCTGGLSVEVDSAGGELALYCERFRYRDPTAWEIDRTGSYPVGLAAEARSFIEPKGGTRTLGCTFSRMAGPEFTADAVVVPYWGAAALSLLLPASAAKRLWSRRRAGAGLRGVCGYDLRATPGRCPECGTVPRVVSAR
jgi:hypothetical protein